MNGWGGAMRDKVDQAGQKAKEEKQVKNAPEQEKEKESAQAASASAETKTETSAAEEDAAEGEFDIADYLEQYKALEQALAAAKQASDDAEAKLLRMQADFDNFRRRSRKEAEEAGQRANADLIATILPVLDNFERALSMMQASADRDGVEMILKQMQQVLENAGLHEIEAEGAVFDPNIHQAVLQESVEDERKGKVLMVMQKGYLLGDKLIRAAVVQVGV